MSKNNGRKGSDQTTIPNVDLREPPASLVALRNELPHHPIIYRESIKGRNFEECLATIAYMLDIAVDGYYDVEPLCDILYNELKRRGTILVDNAPSVPRDSRLVPATLLETKDSLHIERGTIHAEKVDGNMRLGILEEGTPVILSVAESALLDKQRETQNATIGDSTSGVKEREIITPERFHSPDLPRSNGATIIQLRPYKKKAESHQQPNNDGQSSGLSNSDGQEKRSREGEEQKD